MFLPYILGIQTVFCKGKHSFLQDSGVGPHDQSLTALFYPDITMTKCTSSAPWSALNALWMKKPYLPHMTPSMKRIYQLHEALCLGSELYYWKWRMGDELGSLLTAFSSILKINLYISLGSINVSIYREQCVEACNGSVLTCVCVCVCACILVCAWV